MTTFNSIEDDIIAQLGKEMSASIDWEIQAGMMWEMGWTKVQLSRYTDNHHAIDVREWVAKNCQGKSNNNGATWIFEKPADATMFTLRWVK